MLRSVVLIIAAATVMVAIWRNRADESAFTGNDRISAAPHGPHFTGDHDRAPLADITALAELERIHAPATEFWLRDTDAEARRIERILDAERAARRVLIERFGPPLAAAPVFWRLFRPLNERMPQLSSREQITIHEIERQFMAETLEGDGTRSFRDLLVRVRENLGADTANEYALRTSPLANELHRAGFELSEVEFREAFAALSALSQATQPAAFVAARRLLREHLGSRRFARLWALRDPRFRQIESAAQRFDLTDETILAAWAMLLENQEAMLTAISDADPATQQERARGQYEAGRRRLQELVGERAADALLQAIAGRPHEMPE